MNSWPFCSFNKISNGAPACADLVLQTTTRSGHQAIVSFPCMRFLCELPPADHRAASGKNGSAQGDAGPCKLHVPCIILQVVVRWTKPCQPQL